MSKPKRMLRSFFYWSRLLHIYTSALLFALLIFFCVTGYFLNHLQWFSGESHDDSIEVELPMHIAQNFDSDSQNQDADTLDLNPIKHWLKKEYGLAKLSSIDFDLEMGEVLLDYSLPAGYATAIVLVADKKVIVEYRKGDVIAVMNDLHKGRHSGAAWSWVIDISAFLIVFFALTGYAIMFQNKKYRKLAFVLSITGLLSPVVFYFLFVPRIIGV